MEYEHSPNAYKFVPNHSESANNNHHTPALPIRDAETRNHAPGCKPFALEYPGDEIRPVGSGQMCNLGGSAPATDFSKEAPRCMHPQGSERSGVGSDRYELYICMMRSTRVAEFSSVGTGES